MTSTAALHGRAARPRCDCGCVRGFSDARRALAPLAQSGGSSSPPTPKNWWQLELKIVEFKSQNASWEARATLQGLKQGVDGSSGEDFADDIILRLRTDGVLTGCPSWGFSRDECLAEREKRLHAAKRVRDERRRQEIIDNAPKCH